MIGGSASRGKDGRGWSTSLAGEHQGKQRFSVQNPQREQPDHQNLQASKTTNLHPLPAYASRQPLADGHQILRGRVPDRVPRRLQPIRSSHRTLYGSNNREPARPHRRRVKPRKNPQPGAQRPRTPILQRQRQEQVHPIPRSTRHPTYHRLHWKTRNPRQDLISEKGCSDTTTQGELVSG